MTTPLHEEAGPLPYLPLSYRALSYDVFFKSFFSVSDMYIRKILPVTAKLNELFFIATYFDRIS